MELEKVRVKMNTKTEQLRETVMAGKPKIENHGVTNRILENELTFIENRHLEEYFLMAHELVSELKKNRSFLIGPGWDWMLSSHVCRTLGLTNINPDDFSLQPVLIWGDDNSKPTISIEVTEGSYPFVFEKAISLFGYENVARKPITDAEKYGSNEYDKMRYWHNGEKIYYHACALVVCPDGVANHFPVCEITDEDDNKILYTKDYIEKYDNRCIFQFNILQSVSLSRIKKIQKQILDNGKRAPQLYERWIWNENYNLFENGDLAEIPLFGYKSIQKVTKLLMPIQEYGAFNELLNIQGLFSSGDGYSLYDKATVTEYRKKHGIINLMEYKIRPWGILFREDAVRYFYGEVGLSWKQTSEIMKYADTKNENKAEKLKHFYLRQGVDSGYKEEELNYIWDSLFKRKTQKALPSKAHYAGRVYLSVFLAKLKDEFPKEFNTIKEHEQYTKN